METRKVKVNDDAINGFFLIPVVKPLLSVHKIVGSNPGHGVWDLLVSSVGLWSTFHDHCSQQGACWSVDRDRVSGEWGNRKHSEVKPLTLSHLLVTV